MRPYHLGTAQRGFTLVEVLTALAIVAASFPLKVPGLPVYLSISDTFFVAAGMLATGLAKKGLFGRPAIIAASAKAATSASCALGIRLPKRRSR